MASATTPESLESLQQEETSETLTPAQEALQTAILLAIVAQAAIRPYAEEFLTGKIFRADLITAAVREILASMSASRVAGLQAAEETWQAPRVPIPISRDDQELITRSVQTVIARTAQEPRSTGEESPMIKRIGALAEFSCIQEARRGYALATAQALKDSEQDQDLSDIDDSDDIEEIWRFTPSAKACGRCRRLAEQTFTSLDDAPIQGGHPGCTCELSPEYRRKADQ